MLFESYDSNYVISNSDFLSRGSILLGSLKTIHVNQKLIPYTSSAYDLQLNTCLLKFYSEFLERSGIGYLSEDFSKFSYTNIISGQIGRIVKNELFYGKSNIIGYVDTTGTASGKKDSNRIICKAISELLEKNELFLFWYRKKGYRLNLNYKMKKLFEMNGFKMYENFLFRINNLSNWTTILHIVFKNNKLVSYGISCHKNISKAIDNAIKEARILRMLNMYGRKSYFEISSEDNIWLYNWLHTIPIYKENDQVLFENSSYLAEFDLCLHSKIKEFNIALINSPYSSNIGKTISVYSEYLIKCVPIQKNLQYCLDTPIVAEEGGDSILKLKDCILEL